jgi:hypothetical protein
MGTTCTVVCSVVIAQQPFKLPISSVFGHLATGGVLELLQSDAHFARERVVGTSLPPTQPWRPPSPPIGRVPDLHPSKVTLTIPCVDALIPFSTRTGFLDRPQPEQRDF